MVAREGKKPVLKVLDFGLAKATSEGQADSGLTREGQMLGTLDFIAPEQIRDAQSADIRADVYSLGCTLYYLLAGRPPFAGDNLWDLYQAHFSMDAGPLNLVRPEVPVELAALVAKMMAKEPARRFQTPGEVAQALSPFFKPATAQPPGSSAGGSRVNPQAHPTQTSGVSPAPTQAATPSTLPAPPTRKSQRTEADGVSWESLIAIEEDEPLVDVVKPKLWDPKPAPAEEPVRRPPWMWPAIAAASLVGLIALVVIIITIRGKNGETKITVRDDQPFKFETPEVVVEHNPGHISGPPGGASNEQETVPEVKPRVNSLNPNQDGFIPLFNGKDLTGWKTHGTQAGNWRVENGVLIGSGHPGNLYSERGHYKDFHLRLEARINEHGNSGVSFPVPFAGEWSQGYHVDIAGEGTGDNNGALFVPFVKWAPRLAISRSRPRDWFRLEVLADGNHIVTSVDGTILSELSEATQFGRSPGGHILLELCDRHTVVEFRKIEIKELNRKSANGETSGSVPGVSPITEKYNETAGMKDVTGNTVQAVLSNPTSNEVDVPGQPGRRVRYYKGGAIYWSSTTGAHIVYGVIGKKYNEIGGASSELGLPTSDELPAPGGRVSHFQRGSIYYERGAARVEHKTETVARPADSADRGSTEGFVSLFNGRDLTGWKTHPSQPGNWRVEKGILIGSGQTVSHIYSERGDYTDFRLHVEARINNGGNSGVYARASFGPVWPAGAPKYPHGYEAQIQGRRVANGNTGTLFVGANTPVVDVREPLVPTSQWFNLKVRAEGDRVVVMVNDQVTADYVDPERRFLKGHIALQQLLPETRLEIRKIEIKELNRGTPKAGIAQTSVSPRNPVGVEKATPRDAEKGKIDSSTRRSDARNQSELTAPANEKLAAEPGDSEANKAGKIGSGARTSESTKTQPKDARKARPRKPAPAGRIVDVKFEKIASKASNIVYRLAISPDSQRLVHPIWSHCDTFDLKTGKELLSIGDRQTGATAVGPRGTEFCHGVVSGDGDVIVFNNDDVVRILDKTTGKLVRELEPRPLEERVDWLWSSGRDRIIGRGLLGVRFWDSRTGKLLQRWDARDVIAMDVSPCGNHDVVTIDNKHLIRNWNVATGREVMILPDPSKRLKNIKFSRDGRQLLCWESGGTDFYLVDPNNDVVVTFPAIGGNVNQVVAFPDAPLLVSGSNDGTIRVWDENEALIVREERCPAPVHQVLVSPDGNYLVAAIEREIVFYSVNKIRADPKPRRNR